MLEIKNLSKTYSNGVAALKDISLSIPTGLFGLDRELGSWYREAQLGYCLARDHPI
jgi:hypothetical protein